MYINTSINTKYKYTFLVFIFVSVLVNAQIPNNSWRDHLSYNNGHIIAITENKVYCAMKTGGMLSFDKSSREIQKLSKISGLSDAGISAMAYSSEAQVLAIGYKSGNIDLITKSGLINMPDIKRKRITLKGINHITVQGTKAFLACDFGIVELDLVKKEVRDSYFFGPNGSSIKVNRTAIRNNFIYAATESGIYKADLSAPNLVDYTFWNNLTLIPQSGGEYEIVEVLNSMVIAMYNDGSKDIIINIDGNDNFSSWAPVSDAFIRNIMVDGDRINVCTEFKVTSYNSALQLIETEGILRPNHVQTDSDGTLYAGSEGDGFISIKSNSLVSLKVPSPIFSNSGKIDAKGDHVWIGSGGPGNPFGNGAAYNFYDEKWTSLYSNSTEGLGVIGNFYKFAYHPTISNYVYASAFRYALYEIQDYKVVAQHDRSNVTVFQKGIDENVRMRIAGLDIDRNGDLWIVNDITNQPVFVLRGGNKWEHINELKSSNFKANTLWMELLVTKSNQIWILSKREGVVVLKEQPGGTILEKQFKLKDDRGNELTSAFCMTEDKDGNIWIGTNKGPIIFQSGDQIFEQEDVKGSQIKIPRNDGTNNADFLLDYEIINDIAVDGGNRKWIATETSGVLLVSEDGKSTIHQFNEENSPIIANKIISVGVQEKTGEVFISTSEGLVGFMGRATEGGDDFTDVYVYPNPVRPGYSGDITITGLIADANVKVTDISGNLVYETTSLGGQAVWDGKDFSGNKVHTGNYLLFLTYADGSKTHITKLAFIH